MTGEGENSPAATSDRLTGKSWFAAGLILAIAATLVLVLSDDARWLRLGIIAALWAALVGGFIAVKYRKHASVTEESVAQAQAVYELELEREIAARREYELEIEAEAREKIETDSREELDALRAELTALRESLQSLLGGEVLYERVALTAQATRMRALREQRVVQAATAARTGMAGPPQLMAGKPRTNPEDSPAADSPASANAADRPTELMERVVTRVPMGSTNKQANGHENSRANGHRNGNAQAGKAHDTAKSAPGPVEPNQRNGVAANPANPANRVSAASRVQTNPAAAAPTADSTSPAAHPNRMGPRPGQPSPRQSQRDRSNQVSGVPPAAAPSGTPDPTRHLPPVQTGSAGRAAEATRPRANGRPTEAAWTPPWSDEDAPQTQHMPAAGSRTRASTPEAADERPTTVRNRRRAQDPEDSGDRQPYPAASANTSGSTGGRRRRPDGVPSSWQTRRPLDVNGAENDSHDAPEDDDHGRRRGGAHAKPEFARSVSSSTSNSASNSTSSSASDDERSGQHVTVTGARESAKARDARDTGSAAPFESSEPSGVHSSGRSVAELLAAHGGGREGGRHHGRRRRAQD